MTVVNPKSISGITSITTPSGSDDLLTIHTNNGTERLRIDSTGTTKIVTGIVTTLTATTGIVTTLTANTVTSLGAVSGTTGTFSGAVSGTTGAFTGNLTITNTAPQISLVDSDNNSDFSIYGASGSFNIYDETNSASRLLIASDGTVSVLQGLELSSTLTIPDTIVHSGDTNTKIRFPAADTFTVETGGSERIRVDSDGNFGIGMSPSGLRLDVQSTANDIARFSGANSGGITIRNDTNHEVQIHSGNSDALIFGTNGENERFRVASNGSMFFGCTDVTDGGSSVGNNFAFSSDGNPTIVKSHSNMIYGASSNSADRHAIQMVQHRYNRYNFVSVHVNTGITGGHFVFYQGSNVVGTINTSDSSTSFNTSSDYRLKENATVINDGITRLKTLIPRRFNWKIDETNTPVDGFFAHEVTAVPEAVTGTKDQVATADDETNDLKEGDPIYQSIDQSKLVPLLTAALQEAVARIETLEARVATLEGS